MRNFSTPTLISFITFFLHQILIFFKSQNLGNIVFLPTHFLTNGDLMNSQREWDACVLILHLKFVIFKVHLKCPKETSGKTKHFSKTKIMTLHN